MTPLPKRKLSTRRQGTRRSAAHLRLSLALHIFCPHCHRPMLPHRVCPHCGSYNGKLVRAPKTKKTKKTSQ